MPAQAPSACKHAPGDQRRQRPGQRRTAACRRGTSPARRSAPGGGRSGPRPGRRPAARRRCRRDRGSAPAAPARRCRRTTTTSSGKAGTTMCSAQKASAVTADSSASDGVFLPASLRAKRSNLVPTTLMAWPRLLRRSASLAMTAGVDAVIRRAGRKLARLRRCCPVGVEIRRVEPALEGVAQRRPFAVDDREPGGVAVAALAPPAPGGTAPRTGSRAAAPQRATARSANCISIRSGDSRVRRTPGASSGTSPRCRPAGAAAAGCR